MIMFVYQLILFTAAVVFLKPGLLANEVCPSKCVCVNETVRCMFLDLVTIPQVPKETKILDLRFNHIQHLSPSSLNYLKKLHTLLLNNNRLVTIRHGVFNHLHSLRYLYLYKNRISHIDENAFSNLSKLEQLYLQNNHIHDLKPKTFSGLKSLKRLFLHHNKLKRISHGLFDNLPSLKRIRLDSNALTCDCGIKWFVEMINEKNNSIQVAASCQNPSDMLGKSVKLMKDNEFHCQKPKIMENPEDIQVSWGETALLSCKAYGDPEPDIIWMRDENELPIDNKKYIVLNNGTLKIKRSQVDDRGLYECMAKSDMGVAKSRPARMVVTETSTTPSSAFPPREPNPLLNQVYFTTNNLEDSPASYQSNRRNPVFVVKPQDVDVHLRDQNVRLRCRASASGSQKPIIRWSRNGVQIASGSNVLIESSGDLLIRQVEAADFGSYKCDASNHFGRISAEAQIRIYAAPQFSLHPENISSTTGQTIIFECSATALPEPVISWYKDNVLIFNNDRVRLESNNQRLRISQVQDQDSGKYVCRGENSLGSIQTSAYLRVEQVEYSPAKLKIKPFDLEAIPGTTIELPCRAKGNPQPEIQWKKDGSALDRFQFRYRVSNAGSLYISKVSLEDIGTWECIAQNEHGRDHASVTVRVRDERILTPGDKFVRVAFAEATQDIDRAINNTIANLMNKDGRYYSPAELFRRIRYPDAPTRELARAAEIYERTLTIIRRNAEKGMSIKNPADYQYQDLLSPEHVELVAKLSGCISYRASSNCTDMCYHSRYRTMTGVCNNFQHPTWGASNTGFRRILKPIYENGFSTPVGWDPTKKYYGHTKPSARLVSTSVISTNKITLDDHITHMTMQWGQFLDHDLDHATPSVSSQSWDGIDCKKSCEYAAPCYPMEVPPNDPRITDRRCIDFIRSSAVCGSDITSLFFEGFQPREQINQLTSFIDASQVYGFSDELAKNLRDLTTEEGKLREGFIVQGHKPLLPYSDGTQGMDCRINADEEREVKCFAAGDIRVNEQIGLTAMHTIWLREHNRLAKELLLLNPQWSGETIYQEARKIVGAQMQHITYKHWLPLIIGEEGMEILGEYKEYNPNLNPTISNIFATAALRFGHSIINPILTRLNESYQPMEEFGHLPLHKAFFAPWRLADEGGVDPLMRGLITSPAKLKKPTENLNQDLTEKLFNTAHAVSLDLAAMNIQRSRDHAIPGYLEWRQICNLSHAETFDDLKNEIKDSNVREHLRELYGHPGNIDVWVGGILEDQLPGAKIGPLFRCLLIEQFRRLRDGDRFWYENPAVFRPQQLVQIKQASLSRLLCDNGDDIKTITENVFVLPNKQITKEEIDTNIYKTKDSYYEGNYNNYHDTANRKYKANDYFNEENSNRQTANRKEDSIILDGFVSCRKIPKIDLHYWIACCDNGCPNSNFLTRVRRDTPENQQCKKVNDHIKISNFTRENRDISENKFSKLVKRDSNLMTTNKSTNTSNDGYVDIPETNEARLDNLESIIHGLQRQIRHLTKHVRSLEHSCNGKRGVRKHSGKTFGKVRFGESKPDNLQQFSNTSNRFADFVKKIGNSSEKIHTLQSSSHEFPERSSDLLEREHSDKENANQHNVPLKKHWRPHHFKNDKRLIFDENFNQNTRIHGHHSYEVVADYCVDKDGTRHANNETWILNNNCTKCECHKRHITCTVTQCAPVKCNNAITQKGACCPECPDHLP